MDFKIDFVNSVKQAIEIVKLNGKVAENVSKDKNATLMGVLIIIIGGILGQITGLNILVIIPSLVILIIGYFIVVGILHIVARLFGGQAKYIEYSKGVICLLFVHLMCNRIGSCAKLIKSKPLNTILTY